MSDILTPEQVSEYQIRMGIHACSWCGRYFNHEWKEIGRPRNLSKGLVSSGICPTCLQQMKQQYQKPQ